MYESMFSFPIRDSLDLPVFRWSRSRSRLGRFASQIAMYSTVRISLLAIDPSAYHNSPCRDLQEAEVICRKVHPAMRRGVQMCSGLQQSLSCPYFPIHAS